MAGSLPPFYQSLIPSTFTAVETDILSALVDNTCEPLVGQGPILGTNDTASQNCRICIETLAGEFNLRHTGDHTHEGAQVERPCERTYHVACLVGWCESNLRQGRPVNCPADRQTLIPAATRTSLVRRHHLRALANDHVIREIDRVIRFWEILHPDPAQRPNCAFTVVRLDANEVFRLAAGGRDVGFVSRDVVERLPLSASGRRRFDQYDAETRWHATGPRAGQLGNMYEQYVYLNTSRRLVEDQHAAGQERGEYYLWPMYPEVFDSFRRYILGMLGQVWNVEILAGSDHVTAWRDQLADHEVAVLRAETQIRQMMLIERAEAAPAPVHTWFWPFPNYAGGIHVGGTLNNNFYPSRGWRLDNINLGQANDVRYAELLNNPVVNFRQVVDDFIDQYRQGRIPRGFPDPIDIIRRELYWIPHAQNQPGLHPQPLPPRRRPGQNLPRRRPAGNSFQQRQNNTLQDQMQTQAPAHVGIQAMPPPTIVPRPLPQPPPETIVARRLPGWPRLSTGRTLLNPPVDPAILGRGGANDDHAQDSSDNDDDGGAPL